MKVLPVSGMVFYDKHLNILVQERGDYSKTGEKYSFWGGEIKPGETKEEALIRELKEELNYIPEKIEYWDDFYYIFKEDGIYKGWKIEQNVFFSPITTKLLKSKVYEGGGKKLMKLDDVIKGTGFPKGSTDFLKGFKKMIESQGNL